MMLDAKSLETLAPIYVVANTPSFLQQQFAQIPAVRWLSNKSADELKIGLLENLRKPERTMLDDVEVYASLVAFSYKRPDELAVLGDLCEIDKLNWGRKLLQIVQASLRSDTVESKLWMPTILREDRLKAPAVIQTETLPATILHEDRLKTSANEKTYGATSSQLIVTSTSTSP